MSLPTLVGVGPTVVGTTSITVGWPAGIQAGDYAVLCIETATNAAAPSSTSGWSLIRQDATTDPEGGRIITRGRFLPSASMADITITGSMHLSACIAVFRGVNPTTPTESSNTSPNAAATSVTLPTFTAMTSSGSDRLLFYAIATGAAGSYVSGVSSGPSATVARASGHSTGEGGGLSIVVGTSAIGAGTVTKNTVSFNTSTDSAAAHFLLQPSPTAAASGSATSSFTPSGTLRGSVSAAAIAALSIVAVASIGGVGAIAGGASLGISQQADIRGDGALGGSSVFAFDGSGSGVEIPGTGGFSTISVSGSGSIAADGALAGVSQSVFGWEASLSGLLPADGAASIALTASGLCSGQGWLSATAPVDITCAAVPTGVGAIAADEMLVFDVAPAELLGTGTALLEGLGQFGFSGSGQGIRIVDPVIQEHWRVPSPRKVLLLTIGAPPLPEVTPINPVVATGEINPHVAPDLVGPDSLTAVPMLDGAHLAWTYAGPKGVSFVVEVSADVDGAPSGWAIAGSTEDLQYTLGGLTDGTVWLRIYATLNGRNSSTTAPVSVTPIPSYQVTGNATAIASLQDDVSTINGVLTAQATDLVNLDARADALESDVGGLQTQTAALASADEVLDARVTAAEGSITAQSSQLTSLSSSLEINRSIAGRTPLVFRQASAPAVSGSRYNLLLQTAGLTSSTWAKTATATASTVGDPEGYLQAFRVTPTGDGQYVRQDVSGLGSIAGRTFSFSVWIRADTAHTCSIRLVAGTAGTSEVLDVAASNFWQRVTITHAYASETDTSLRIEIYPKQFGSTGQPNNHIDVFGPQLNEGVARQFQRVSVANDYDGNGIPPLSTWYDTDDGNKEYGWQLSGGTMQWLPGSDTRIAATAAATEALDTRVTAAEGTISTQASQITSINAALPGKASVSAVEALDVRIDATEAGVATYFASYTLTLDVNGKISGFKSVNDGTTSLFEVNADLFRLTKPGGGDALTWEYAVLTALKGSHSVKLGAGFGSSNDLIFWYGADGSTGTRTVENAKFAITKDGLRKLGSTQVNFGSGWTSGGAISYSATPTSATISVTAGTFAMGSQQVSYSASSASVSGTSGTSTTFWLYYDDPGLTGGSKTLVASTAVVDTYNSDSRVLVGSVAVAFPASGSSGGGGSGGYDPECVDYDTVLPDGRLVRDLQPGDLVECVDVRTGVRGMFPLLALGFGYANCYRVTTRHGEVIQSDTTPMDMPDGSVVRTPDLAGCPVLHRTWGFEPASIEFVGMRRVCKPDLGDRMFFAGTRRHRCVATHNIRYKDPTAP